MYERKCPISLHVVDAEMIEKVGHEVESGEEDREKLVKILIRGSDECPEVLKLEILCKKDYFFLFEHEMNVFDFNDMREQQGLVPQFADYLTMLIKLFNNTITNPDTYRC